jgi:hypothetical protein
MIGADNMIYCLMTSGSTPANFPDSFQRDEVERPTPHDLRRAVFLRFFDMSCSPKSHNPHSLNNDTEFHRIGATCLPESTPLHLVQKSVIEASRSARLHKSPGADRPDFNVDFDDYCQAQYAT